MKELYGKRKETIERDFGTAKEHHGMRYTQQIGKEIQFTHRIGNTAANMGFARCGVEGNLRNIIESTRKKPFNFFF